MTRADEDRLRLIRFDRWLQRRAQERRARLWIEISGLALATALIAVLIARVLP